MLAALIAFQNEARPAPRPSTIKIELRGGGGPRIPMYDIVDYTAALAAFPEITGEDSLTRAARLRRFLDTQLPAFKDARERRDAAMFLSGAQLADLAAEERFAIEREQITREQLARDLAARERARAHDRSVLAAVAIAGVGAGILIGISLATRKKRKRRTPRRLRR